MDTDKEKALQAAIDIARAYAAAGLDKDSPAKVIRETYAAIIKIQGSASPTDGRQ